MNFSRSLAGYPRTSQETVAMLQPVVGPVDSLSSRESKQGRTGLLLTDIHTGINDAWLK
jgi:hypothetical protein